MALYDESRMSMLAWPVRFRAFRLVRGLELFPVQARLFWMQRPRLRFHRTLQRRHLRRRSVAGPSLVVLPVVGMRHQNRSRRSVLGSRLGSRRHWQRLWCLRRAEVTAVAGKLLRQISSLLLHHQINSGVSPLCDQVNGSRLLLLHHYVNSRVRPLSSRRRKLRSRQRTAILR